MSTSVQDRLARCVARHRSNEALALAARDQRIGSSARPTPNSASRAQGPQTAAKVPTLGITGTGGAGKSTCDELVRRIRLDQGDKLQIAVISIDPSRRKSGGALLGDRIRMNAINPWSDGPKVYMRSLATREAGKEISQALPDVIAACRLPASIW